MGGRGDTRSWEGCGPTGTHPLGVVVQLPLLPLPLPSVVHHLKLVAKEVRSTAGDCVTEGACGWWWWWASKGKWVRSDGGEGRHASHRHTQASAAPTPPPKTKHQHQQPRTAAGAGSQAPRARWSAAVCRTHLQPPTRTPEPPPRYGPPPQTQPGRRRTQRRPPLRLRAAQTTHKSEARGHLCKGARWGGGQFREGRRGTSDAGETPTNRTLPRIRQAH